MRVGPFLACDIVAVVVVVVVEIRNLSICVRSAHNCSISAAVNSNLARFLVGSDWNLHPFGFDGTLPSPIPPISPGGCFEFLPTEL